MMSFLSAVITSRYPTTNNQLRNSSNPRQQATINDGRVTLQPVQGRQISFATGTTRTYTLGASGSNYGKQRTVICYNCKGEGHMSKQCTKPKRKRDDSWFRDKVLLVQAQANGQILHEKELAFLADPRIAEDAPAGVHNPDNVDNNMTNQDNKSVNDTLIVELERYKEQVKVLKEGQNVDLKSKDNVSNSCEQFFEIDRLKQILSEYLKEKESLMQIVTLLKNDFKKEESRNIDREIALKKKIKELDNIVYKRDQSAQIVHMLTKPQFFYDDTTKQALGFQNPFYLKKAQQLEPKLYDGNVIKSTSAIVILDSEETLMLAEESHLEKRFVPQTKLSAKQAFWSQNSMNSSDLSPSCRPTKVEVPKELPKVSMINTSLKKLKHHLAGFDVVFKERTTDTAITEGSWGFKHTKACFRDKIIPFVKALKDIFNAFDQYLINELTEVQNIFHQMEQAVKQYRLESKTFEECEKCLKLETELLNKKDFIEKETYDKLFRSFTSLEKHCISLEVDTQLNQEIFQRDNSVSNQSAPNFDQYFELNELKAQSQEKDTTYKQLYDSIKLARIRSKEQCDALINQVNQKYVEISDLNAKLQEQGLIVTAIKNDLRKLKGKALVDNAVTKHTIDLEMLKIDVEQLAPRLLNNRIAHSDYLRHTQEQAAILREVVEQGKSQNPLNNSLDSALAVTPKNKDKRVRFTQPVTSSGNTKTSSSSNLFSNKPVLSSIGVRPSTSASGSQPSTNTKKDKI
ncbi:putative ribonuclease H-like domain-containing protein [Tanacetum coccineum]|uniref:Ribonuclease H-like domain-containing protein n=1 Tax=Tanacetum coccineum TaxID=301880 RepID=A0ABQ4YIK7_9ASTR